MRFLLIPFLLFILLFQCSGQMITRSANWKGADYPHFNTFQVVPGASSDDLWVVEDEQHVIRKNIETNEVEAAIVFEPEEEVKSLTWQPEGGVGVFYFAGYGKYFFRAYDRNGVPLVKTKYGSKFEELYGKEPYARFRDGDKGELVSLRDGERILKWKTSGAVGTPKLCAGPNGRYFLQSDVDYDDVALYEKKDGKVTKVKGINLGVDLYKRLDWLHFNKTGDRFIAVISCPEARGLVEHRAYKVKIYDISMNQVTFESEWMKGDFVYLDQVTWSADEKKLYLKHENFLHVYFMEENRTSILNLKTSGDKLLPPFFHPEELAVRSNSTIYFLDVEGGSSSKSPIVSQEVNDFLAYSAPFDEKWKSAMLSPDLAKMSYKSGLEDLELGYYDLAVPSFQKAVDFDLLNPEYIRTLVRTKILAKEFTGLVNLGLEADALSNGEVKFGVPLLYAALVTDDRALALKQARELTKRHVPPTSLINEIEFDLLSKAGAKEALISDVKNILIRNIDEHSSERSRILNALQIFAKNPTDDLKQMEGRVMQILAQEQKMRVQRYVVSGVCEKYLGDIAIQSRDFKKAIGHYEKSLEYYLKLGDVKLIIKDLEVLADCYYELKDTNLAVQKLTEMKLIAERYSRLGFEEDKNRAEGKLQKLGK